MLLPTIHNVREVAWAWYEGEIVAPWLPLSLTGGDPIIVTVIKGGPSAHPWTTVFHGDEGREITELDMSCDVCGELRGQHGPGCVAHWVDEEVSA